MKLVFFFDLSLDRTLKNLIKVGLPLEKVSSRTPSGS